MNYAKATTEQELLDMVAYLESKGYEIHDLCLFKPMWLELTICPYVGICEVSGKINNCNDGTMFQGHEVSVSDFLKQ